MIFSYPASWVKKLMQYAVHGNHLLLASMLLAMGGTVSAVLPTTYVIIPAVMLAPKRWRSIATISALGSAIGALTLVVIFYHLGTAQIYSHFPALVTNASWIRVAKWTAQYGIVTLFLVAASPLPQTPALLFYAMVPHDNFYIFIAMLGGKVIKYWLFAWATTRCPKGLGEGIRRYFHLLFRFIKKPRQE